MDQAVTFIGIDIGSFKTAITSSSGRRVVIPSIVGWPKDDASREKLGHDFVVGNDVARQQQSLEIAFPFRRGALELTQPTLQIAAARSVDRNREAAELVMKHALSLVTPTPGSAIYGVLSISARASEIHKRALLTVTRKFLNGVMLSSSPFNIAYSTSRLHETLVIDFGAGTTNLARLNGSYPREDDERSLPIGSESIDHEIVRLISASQEKTELSLNTARRIKEKYGCLLGPTDTAVVKHISAATPNSTIDLNVTEYVRTACRQTVPAIVNAVRDLTAKLGEPQRRKILENVQLAGGGTQLKGFSQLLQDNLAELGGAKVTLVPDAVFAAAAGALKLAMNLPIADWQRLDTSVSKPQTRAA